MKENKIKDIVKIVKEFNGIPVAQLPPCSMKVKWLCEDGVEDVGFYNEEQNYFAGWDLLSQSRITHWKPFIPLFASSQTAH